MNPWAYASRGDKCISKPTVIFMLVIQNMRWNGFPSCGLWHIANFSPTLDMSQIENPYFYKDHQHWS